MHQPDDLHPAPSLEARLAAVERRARRLQRLLAAAGVLWAATLALLLAAGVPASYADPSPPRLDSLRLRSLVIEDAHGHDRVRLGAPLPDPILLGRRMSRGGSVSGILLFDGEGNERSGYITGDDYPNVVFTLDDLARQRVLFLTEPQGATSLWMWADSGNMVRLGASEERSTLQVLRGQSVLFDALDSTRGGRR